MHKNPVSDFARIVKTGDLIMFEKEWWEVTSTKVENFPLITFGLSSAETNEKRTQIFYMEDSILIRHKA